LEEIMLKIRGIVPLVVLALIAGCGWSDAAETIRDLRTLPQDARAYLSPASEARPAVTAEDQDRLDARYNEQFLSPWRQTQPRHGVEELDRSFKRYRKAPGYAENGRPHTPEWIDELRASAQFETYPNAVYAGMTIRPTDVRVLPTKKPRFGGLNGYPFDLFQQTALPVNTPVCVVHATRDKDWLLVETAWFVGWIPAEDVARMNEAGIRAWERGPYVTILRDGVPVYGAADGMFLFHAPLGAMFPLAKARDDGWEVFVTVANEKREAVTRLAFAASGPVTRKPLPLTPRNIAGQINELIREPYGWGGLNGSRDCSATLRDLFAPFGIWLPRNSSEQARQGGGVINLKRLRPEIRKEQILSRGIPFLTLLWEPGHIMLYVGSVQGEIVVFHNFWSVKARDRKGRVQQKVIVGQAAITTLHPGEELEGETVRTSNRLHALWAMTLLVPPAL